MKAEKPVELFDAILPFVTLPGEKVLDSFAGSGNVGISAVRNGRDAVLMELSEDTFEKMRENVSAGIGASAICVQEEGWQSPANPLQAAIAASGDQMSQRADKMRSQQFGERAIRGKGEAL